MKKELIENKINKIFDRFGINKYIPVDIIYLTKQLGFVVGNVDLPDTDDGFIYINKNEKDVLGQNNIQVIGVNACLSVEWKRFTIAHELGHYFLHFSENTDGLFAHREHRKGKGKKENEADYFAACLLMPRDAFTTIYKELSKTNITKDDILSFLAYRFNVTSLMVERRIEELKLNV